MGFFVFCFPFLAISREQMLAVSAADTSLRHLPRERGQPGASELAFQHPVKRASPSMWAITQGSGPCGRAGPGSLERHCLSRQQLEISWIQRGFVSEGRALDTQRGGIFSLVGAGDSGLPGRGPARRAAGWRGCRRGEHSEMLSLNIPVGELKETKCHMHVGCCPGEGQGVIYGG